jgi:hypothetical protein
MWDFSVSKALIMMQRTAPFILFRVIVYAAITLAFIVVTGTGAGFGYGIGTFGTDDFQAGATFWGGAIGFGAVAGGLFLARDYLLYLVKAGHIAVMVEIMQGREVPWGRAQIEHAHEVVGDRFGEASALFALDRLIAGVVAAVTGLVEGVLSILPIPGLEKIMSLVRAYLRVAVGLVDEVILAHGLKTKAENPWDNARTALVLYAQNAKPMLRNAVPLTAIVYGLSFVVFLVMLLPAALIAWLIPGDAAGVGFLFALVLAWAVKAAVIEPFAIACLLQVFFKVTDGQVPDPEWEARLTAASDKFRKIGDHASAWMGSRIRGLGGLGGRA